MNSETPNGIRIGDQVSYTDNITGKPSTSRVIDILDAGLRVRLVDLPYSINYYECRIVGALIAADGRRFEYNTGTRVRIGSYDVVLTIGIGCAAINAWLGPNRVDGWGFTYDSIDDALAAGSRIRTLVEKYGSLREVDNAYAANPSIETENLGQRVYRLRQREAVAA